jgi:hypothetical protein
VTAYLSLAPRPDGFDAYVQRAMRVDELRTVGLRVLGDVDEFMRLSVGAELVRLDNFRAHPDGSVAYYLRPIVALQGNRIHLELPSGVVASSAMIWGEYGR